MQIKELASPFVIFLAAVFKTLYTNNILGWLVFYREKSTIKINYLQVFTYPAMIFLSKLF